MLGPIFFVDAAQTIRDISKCCFGELLTIKGFTKKFETAQNDDILNPKTNSCSKHLARQIINTIANKRKANLIQYKSLH